MTRGWEGERERERGGGREGESESERGRGGGRKETRILNHFSSHWQLIQPG